MKMSFKIVLWGAIAVVLAVITVVVFTPSLVWKPQPTLIAHPYTAAEERGRVLFYSNACNYCHTQYVRESDTGMGPVSQAGDYYYDQPLILGSIRTGPDLSYIGRKRTQQWEIDHMKDPRQYSPMSVMPDFTFLSDADLRYISDYLFALGDRNAAEFMVEPPAAYQSAKSPKYATAVKSTAATAAPQGWPTFKASGLYEGKEIYASHCMTCHGCAGNGLGTYGGTLIVTPANFKVDPFRTMPDDQWFWHVAEGVQGTVMPPWKQSLTVSQRWSVIHYVQQMYAAAIERDPNEGDPPAAYQLTDPLKPTLDNIDAGKRIWTRECAVCHGDAGRGDGIYRAGIEPVPPDFQNPGSAVYQSTTDADYFWRISEGVPWTAMPTWKLVYDTTERWQLVTYIRTMFTLTTTQPPQPTEAQKITTDPVMKAQTLPSSADYDSGRQQFLVQCAHCHGLAGDGKGWDAAALDPKPADLQQKLAPTVAGIMDRYDGITFSKITNGMRDTAMPIWGEFLNLRMRWDDVKYVKDSYTTGLPAGSNASHYGAGAVPLPHVRADSGVFESEISTILPSNGKTVYEKYCLTCHGATGQGDGPGAAGLLGGHPAPFAKNMDPTYVFAVTRGGISKTHMYSFQPLLSESDIWDVSAYVLGITGEKWGG
jgi:cbb3-type cytochrome c oxidase subunit II